MVKHFHKNISRVDLQENLSNVSDILRKWVAEPKDSVLWRQGKRLLFKKVELFEQNGDNVIKDEVTLRAEFKEYRISRIIKRMIAKRLCQTKENI